MTTLTAADRILLAVADLEALSAPVPVEAIVVECWRRSPQTFGLKGYAGQYPDSNKVTAYLAGERGLVRRGWLRRPAVGLLALTPKGRRRARQLRSEHEARLADRRGKLLAARRA